MALLGDNLILQSLLVELTVDAQVNLTFLSLSLSVQMIRNHPLFAGNPQAAEMVSCKKKGRKERRRKGSECCGK